MGKFEISSTWDYVFEMFVTIYRMISSGIQSLEFKFSKTFSKFYPKKVGLGILIWNDVTDLLKQKDSPVVIVQCDGSAEG